MSRFPSFFRQSPGSSRRTAARAADGSPVSIAFDRWLDAELGGRPAPGADIKQAHSLSDADRSAFASLTETFRRIDRLDTRATGRGGSPDTRLQADIWEDIMQATLSLPSGEPSTLAAPVPSGIPVRSPIPHAGRDRRTRTGGFAQLSPVLNVAMAALLVLVLGLSAWTLAGTRWAGNGPGNTNDPGGFASLAALDPNATPASTTQGILPTADECTIAPLTIDQVMERIKGPFPGSIDNVPVVESSPIAYGTPPLLRNVPPQQADIDAIAKVQREFVACSIKGDLLQVWAFYAPSSEFWRSFLDRYPRFVDEATVRADLEAYLQGEQNLFLPGLGWDGVWAGDGSAIPGGLPLVNPDPQASLTIGDQMTSQGRVADIVVSMLYYNPDKPDAAPQYIPREQMAKVWVYEWDEASRMWMISQVGLDANRG